MSELGGSTEYGGVVVRRGWDLVTAREGTDKISFTIASQSKSDRIGRKAKCQIVAHISIQYREL